MGEKERRTWQSDLVSVAVAIHEACLGQGLEVDGALDAKPGDQDNETGLKNAQDIRFFCFCLVFELREERGWVVDGLSLTRRGRE